MISEIADGKAGEVMNFEPFQEYIRNQEPAKREKGYAWHTAIGLQAVDGLKTSLYLVGTAVRNIEGEISFEEAEALLESYYRADPRPDVEDRTEEADMVSLRIAALLSEKAFSFTPNEYISIHRKLFTGIYPHAGRLRNYNITKKEWVLDGATVIYGTATELHASLEYDFSLERRFSYQNLSMDEIIRHLASFVSRLWQIHVFCEGNTRTTAVFFIKYLRMLGFDVTNDIFATNAWYFRNALVRANYSDLKKGIHGTTEYLELFLRNMLLDEKNPLHNRALHVSWILSSEQKADIDPSKADIGRLKKRIENVLRPKAVGQILIIRENFPGQSVFARPDVMELLNMKQSGASELLRKMLDHGIIVAVAGQGKGKYRFQKTID